MSHDLLAAHVERFNAGVRSGDLISRLVVSFD